MIEFIKANWKPISGSMLLVAIYLVSKHPRLADEHELLERIAILWGVLGITAIQRVEHGD